MDYNLGKYRPNPRGKYKDTESYRYLDMVSFNGSGYININLDTIDGTACIGIAPEGEDKSGLYWMCIAERGDQGPEGTTYKPFSVITDGVWDIEQHGDKIYIPENGLATVSITNQYDGLCGIIITNKELNLPSNSDYSIDYEYVKAKTNQYYCYSFIYIEVSDNPKFIWHRTVINQ